MGDTLDFFGQKWEAARMAGLTAHIRHTDTKPDTVQFGLMQEFYPPWALVRDEDGCTSNDPCRTLTLDVDLFAPCDGDWRNLANLLIRHQEEISSFGEVVQRQTSPPEFTLTSCGDNVQHCHLKDGWECAMQFGACGRRDPFSFPFNLNAFCPSDRARAAYRAWCKQVIQSWFDATIVPPPLEQVAGIDEGRPFHYRGCSRLIEIHCTVPENAADPIGYARTLARKRLGLGPEDFGFCRVNGGNRYLETWEPHHGILPEIGGRLVILDTIDDYHRQYAAEVRQSAVVLDRLKKSRETKDNA